MTQRGDLYGETWQANKKIEQENRDTRQVAVNRINENRGLRYVELPGGGQWPVPSELASLFGLE